MPDQTPEPLTDARLLQLRDDEYVCTNANERSMAAELIAARERIHEWRVHLAEIVDAIGAAEDTRFDCLPDMVRERVAELEAAQDTPDAYIAVKRYHAVSADGPEWCDDAAVIPAGHIHAWEREDHQRRGYQLLPIVADGDGTRFAATPPARCQATTASPLIDDRRSLWCELPAGHAGMHHAAVPQPGFPATEVDWDDTVEAGR